MFAVMWVPVLATRIICRHLWMFAASLAMSLHCISLICAVRQSIVYVQSILGFVGSLRRSRNYWNSWNRTCLKPSEFYHFLSICHHTGTVVTTCSELRKVLFLVLSLTLLFVCLCMKYLRNRWTDLHQIHTEDVFSASLGRVWRSRSKV